MDSNKYNRMNFHQLLTVNMSSILVVIDMFSHKALCV